MTAGLLRRPDFGAITFGNWAIIVYAAFGSMIAGFLLWNHVMKVLRSYEASLLGCSGVVMTALLAMPILGQRLSLEQWLGIVLMLVGVTVVQLRNLCRRTEIA